MCRLTGAAATLGILVPLVAVVQWIAPAPYFNGFGASTAAESYQRGFADVVVRLGQSDGLDGRAKLRASPLDGYSKPPAVDRCVLPDAESESGLSRVETLAANVTGRDHAMGPARTARPSNGDAARSADGAIELADHPPRLSQYADDREQLDKLFAERATSSSVSLDMYRQVQNTTNDLLAVL